MLRSHLSILAALGFAGACAQHSSHLDGPVDYDSGGGYFGGGLTVHLELDGSATMVVRPSDFDTNNGGDPTPITTHGVIPADMMTKLRADVAAVDLTSMRHDYDCAHFRCGEDGGVDSIKISADGRLEKLSVNRNISDSDVDPGLLALLSDMSMIATQIHDDPTTP